MDPDLQLNLKFPRPGSLTTRPGAPLARALERPQIVPISPLIGRVGGSDGAIIAGATLMASRHPWTGAGCLSRHRRARTWFCLSLPYDSAAASLPSLAIGALILRLVPKPSVLECSRSSTREKPWQNFIPLRTPSLCRTPLPALRREAKPMSTFQPKLFSYASNAPVKLLTCRAKRLYTPRPYVIEEEEEEAEEEDSSSYDTDDAAPSVNIPRYRGQTTDQSRKRSSMPPAITSAKTSIYRTANSIISQRTSISENQNGIQYRSQFESVPAAEKGWEMHTQFQRPMSIFSVTSGPRHSKAPSIMQPRIFQMLPREVFDCVLQQLEVLHFGKGAQSCTTCYLRDLYNLALTSRKWDKAARSKL